MEWQDYIADLLAQKCSFDGISLSFNEGASLTGVPPIIKSSILLLDQMLAQELDRNFFVFPEKTQSIFFFTLIKLLHNITAVSYTHLDVYKRQPSRSPAQHA